MSPRKPTTRRQYDAVGGKQTRIPIPVALSKRTRTTTTTTTTTTSAEATTSTTATTKTIAVLRKASPSRRKPVVPTLASTRALRSTTARGGASGQDKENFPVLTRNARGSGRESATGGRVSNRPKGKDGVQKKALGKPNALQPRKGKRVPLRELTEAEVFERDEAVIGDLRRRRISGDNHIMDVAQGSMVEIDTVWAHEPVPSQEGEGESGAVDAQDDASNEQFEPVTPMPAPQPIERFQVLRRSDSEERLKATLESIALAAPPQPKPRPRTRASLKGSKSQHPATRTSTGSMFSLDGASIMVHSAEASPVGDASALVLMAPPTPMAHYAGVRKSVGGGHKQASPSPLKMLIERGGAVGVFGAGASISGTTVVPKKPRVGLGVKSINTTTVAATTTAAKKVLGEKTNSGSGKITVLKEKNAGPTKGASGKEKEGLKRKVNPLTAPKEGVLGLGLGLNLGLDLSSALVAPRGKSGLKRAAGGISGSSNARAGLAGIGRMR